MLSGEKGLSDFKFGTFIGHFQREGTASIAVKGLKKPTETMLTAWWCVVGGGGEG